MITAEITSATVFDSRERILRLGLDSAGLVLSREEFLAIDDFDELFRYELIHGVVVVSPYPGPGERGPNDVFAHWLWVYHDNNPNRSTLDETLPEQAIDTGVCIRRADRVIWTGLGRQPVPMQDVPAIVIEFVSKTRRDRKRDYEEKRAEYAALGVREYWVIDRFRRTMTICCGDEVTRIVQEKEVYETSLLPGFQFPLGEMLKVADR